MNFIRAVQASALVAALMGVIPLAQASPVCTTTIVLPGGNGTVLDSSLSSGVCVQSQDKLYGTFNFGNVPQPGSVTFGFTTISGIDQHTITFTDPFLPGNVYTESFEVAVLQGGGFPTGNSITQLRADITQTVGGPTTLVQTPSIAPNSGSINLSKTSNVVTGSFVDNFTTAQNVTGFIVSSTLTTGAGSDASAILNTIIESQSVAVPEPTSAALLGTALIALGLFRFRPKAKPE